MSVSACRESVHITVVEIIGIPRMPSTVRRRKYGQFANAADVIGVLGRRNTICDSSLPWQTGGRWPTSGVPV